MNRAGPAFALALLVLGAWATSLRDMGAAGKGSTPLRLLGPIANLAAGWQWVRVRMALDDGKPDLAYARAELALELDPTATDGWAYLAATMAFDRASPYRQPSPALRTRWTEVALEVLERGEARAEHPAELAVQRGLILVFVGDSQGEVPWPGGVRGAWEAARAAFERATQLDPGDAEGWAQLAAHRVLRLGAPPLEPEAAGRVRALEEALAVLERALGAARHPEVIEFQRGALLGLFAESGDGAAWPGGAAALLREALRAFERAGDLGFPPAAEAARAAREALDALE